MSSPAPDHGTRSQARPLDRVGVLQIGALAVLAIVGPGARLIRPDTDGMTAALAVATGAFLVAVAAYVWAARTQPPGSRAVRVLAYAPAILGIGAIIMLVASLIT